MERRLTEPCIEREHGFHLHPAELRTDSAHTGLAPEALVPAVLRYIQIHRGNKRRWGSVGCRVGRLGAVSWMPTAWVERRWYSRTRQGTASQPFSGEVPLSRLASSQGRKQPREEQALPVSVPVGTCASPLHRGRLLSFLSVTPVMLPSSCACSLAGAWFWGQLPTGSWVLCLCPMSWHLGPGLCWAEGSCADFSVGLGAQPQHPWYVVPEVPCCGFVLCPGCQEHPPHSRAGSRTPPDVVPVP